MHIFIFNLVALFFFSLLCCDSSYAVKAPGYNTDLRIHQDGIMKTHNGLQVYTSVVRYSSHTSASMNKERLAALTRQAYAEMQQAHTKYVDDCRHQQERYWRDSMRPSMISAIAIGNEVYFSSVLKGNSKRNILLQNENAKLSIALQQCLAEVREWSPLEVPASKAHRSGGNCGEIIAASLHLKVHRELPWDRQGKENLKTPILVAYGTPGKEEIPPSIQNPCTVNEGPASKNIGCRQFAQWQEWDYANKHDKGFIEVTEDPVEYVDVNLNNVWEIEDVGTRDPLHSA